MPERTIPGPYVVTIGFCPRMASPGFRSRGPVRPAPDSGYSVVCGYQPITGQVVTIRPVKKVR